MVSNDSGLQKMNPLTIHFFNCWSHINYAKIDDALNQYDIGWDMCVEFGVDNTNGLEKFNPNQSAAGKWICLSCGMPPMYMSYGAQHCL